MRFLVDIAYILVAVVLSPLLIYRMLVTGKYRKGWDHRRGKVPDLPQSTAIWPRVWIHAVSVGEINAIRGLVQRWQAASPETSFVISTTTDTGYARAQQLFSDLTVIRYPLDLSWWVARALNRISPTLIVLTELEVWYQFINQTAAREIPVAVINGRLSEKSLKWFSRIPWLSRRMFGQLSWVAAQDETYAERFVEVGTPADKVEVTGSMKWDTAEVIDEMPGTDALAAAMGISCKRPLWVCGSTGPGEEKVLLQAYAKLQARHPALQLALVPRKPERFDEVAELIARQGFDCVRRSESPDGNKREPGVRTVLLGDTMGELRKFYMLANFALVGRSLVPMGGSDMMEVAALAKPVIIGPHTDNFADMVLRFKKHKAIYVIKESAENEEACVAALVKAVGQFVDNAPAARMIGDAGRSVVIANRGATDRVLKGLRKLT